MNRLCWVLCVLSVLFWMGCNKEAAVQSPAKSAHSGQNAQAPQASETIETKSASLSETVKNGTFDCQYPVVGIEAFDGSIRQKVGEIRAKADELFDEPAFAGRSITFEVRYEVYNQTDGLDILFVLYSNVEGSPHPNAVVETLSIDGDGRAIPTVELLNGADFDVLLTMAEEKIKEEHPDFADFDMHAYVKPEIENFRHAVRTKDGKMRYFFDGELLPHVYGIISVDL